MEGESESTKVKICGVTNLADAELAVELGAWAVGVVFHPESPRSCEPDAAAEIGQTLKRRSEVAGVFVNEHLDRVALLADECGLTILQLHGDEGPAYCAEAARRTGAKVVKAIQIRSAASLTGLAPYVVDYYLLDGYARGVRGGTGQTFDWRLVPEHRLNAPVILSGGLNPDNVVQAIAESQPFAVDVASGVEAEPGRKDPAKLRAFFAATRSPAVRA